MRVRTMSACAVFAWGLLLVVMLAAGTSGQFCQPRANIGMARVSGVITLASPAGAAATGATAARAAARYVVQPGDTLSGIAARLDVRGGWPALYAANRAVIGPDPDLIDPGAVLVLPGRSALTRYTVAAGDTLSGIAAGLAVPGGWPALYAANRRVIGPDPGLIRPGTVLAVPGPAAPAVSRPAPARRRPTPRPAPVSHRRHRRPIRQTAPAGAGLPSWLKTTLLAAALVVGAAFLVEPVLASRHRRSRPRAARVTRPAPPAHGPGPGEQPSRGRAGVMVADHHRLVVSYDQHRDTACVLRPPGEDPATIMKVARLVLPESRYAELAARLGVPVTWPIILADHDRVVVTCSNRDDTAYVLRPPGEDPRAVLRAARLVLPEGAYAELAEQLGVPASWPMEPR
jgi:LysM repeat protein